MEQGTPLDAFGPVLETVNGRHAFVHERVLDLIAAYVLRMGKSSHL